MNIETTFVTTDQYRVYSPIRDTQRSQPTRLACNTLVQNLHRKKKIEMQDLKVVLQSIRWFPGFTPVVIRCLYSWIYQFCLRLVSPLLSFVWATLLLVDSPLHSISGSIQDHSHHSTPCTRTSKGQEGSEHFANSSRYRV